MWKFDFYDLTFKLGRHRCSRFGGHEGALTAASTIME